MLLHRLGMEHGKPKANSRQLELAKQAAFIKRYDELMDQLAADEDVCRCGASDACGTTGWLLGTEGSADRRATG